MRDAIDEIREGDEGGGKADCGTVESCDENLGMRVEGLGYVEVVGDEVAEPCAAGVFAFWCLAGDGYIGSSEFG